MRTDKTLIEIIMAIQVLLIIAGIYLITKGELFSGIFNIILNTAFFIVNIYNLKRK